MPNFNINYNPKFTKYVVEQELLKDSKIIIFDIGARGGVDKCWESLGEDCKIYAFEPDREECAKLNEKNQKENIQYIPVALAEKSGIRDIYLNKLEDGISFFKTNTNYVDKFQMSKNLDTQKIIQVETMDLIEVCRTYKIGNVDLIKIDAEGAELEILKGAGNLLSNSCTVVSEIRFTNKLNGSPPFSNLMDYLNTKNFDLYDLDIYRFSRKVLPTPFLYDFRDGSGLPVPGPTISGQVLSGDALFFSENIETFEPLQIIKYIVLLEIFGLNDVAVEILIQEKNRIESLLEYEVVLNLLTPQVRGTDLNYEEYMRQFEINNTLFRPKSGFRYRENIFNHYE